MNEEKSQLLDELLGKEEEPNIETLIECFNGEDRLFRYRTSRYSIYN